MDLRLRRRSVSGEKDGKQEQVTLVPAPLNRVLQNLYYGNIKNKMETEMEASIEEYEGKLVCGCCLDPFKTSQEIMVHCYGHVKYTIIPGSPEGSCNYCLKYFGNKFQVDAHVQEKHTLLAERFCCRICQDIFPDKGKVIGHMWKNHTELDIPYMCGLCGFCSSMHADVIDHFQMVHGCSDYVICPFCMKILTVRTQDCIKQIYIHLQSHRIKRNKKCPKCILMFSDETVYQSHVSHAHKSQPPTECDRYILSEFEEAIIMPTKRPSSNLCN